MSYPRRNPPPQGPGIDPDPLGIVVPALQQHLAERREAKGDRPTADDTRLRGSWAFDCSRKIAFQVLGIAPDIALDGDTMAAFEVGQAWHDVLQEAGAQYLGWECEVAASYAPDLSLSLHLDALETLPDGRRAVVEIKSIADYGYGVATGENPRKPYGEARPGPEPRHLVQAGLGAMAPNIGADAVHYIACGKDKGQVAEWVIDLDEPLAHVGGDTLRMLVNHELMRLAGLLSDVDLGTLPERFIPEYGVIEHPPARASRNDPWVCRYCAWQPTCAGLATEAVPVAFLTGEGAA